MKTLSRMAIALAMGFLLVVFWVGCAKKKVLPPDTVTANCSADKTSVVEGSGDIVAISVQAVDPRGHTLNYAWSATGGKVDGTGPSAHWDSSGVGPGTYTVSVKVDDGVGNTASCSEDIAVTPKPIPPPTMSCSADRSSVLPGERVGITANVNDQSGTALTYTWHTTGGQISGSGASVGLDTSGLAAGNYTVTGRVENAKGGAADCTVTVGVQTPPPAPQATKLNQFYFAPGSARVNNVGKRVLDDVALRLNSDTKAKVVLVGYSDPRESKKLGLSRAQSAKKYLAGKGIADTRIDVRSATGEKGAGKENRRVDVIWVPEGATY